MLFLYSCLNRDAAANVSTSFPISPRISLNLLPCSYTQYLFAAHVEKQLNPPAHSLL